MTMRSKFADIDLLSRALCASDDVTVLASPDIEALRSIVQQMIPLCSSKSVLQVRTTAIYSLSMDLRQILVFAVLFSLSALADAEHPVRLYVGKLAAPDDTYKGDLAFCEFQAKVRPKLSSEDCIKEKAAKQSRDFGKLRINRKILVGENTAIGLQKETYSFQSRDQGVTIDFARRTETSFCASMTAYGSLAVDPCRCTKPISKNL